jgi:hypothetical protein
MFGLQTDVQNHVITLAPHVPADWTSFGIRNVHLGGVTVDFQYRKTRDSVTVEANRNGAGDCWVEFSPAFSLRTTIASVEMNGGPLPFKIQPNGEDQHVSMRFPLRGGVNRIVIRVKNDFGLAFENELPALGSTSRGLRVIAESWNPARDQLSLEVSGVPGESYELQVWNPEQIISVDGGVLTKEGKIQVGITAAKGHDYSHQTAVIHFQKP